MKVLVRAKSQSFPIAVIDFHCMKIIPEVFLNIDKASSINEELTEGLEVPVLREKIILKDIYDIHRASVI